LSEVLLEERTCMEMESEDEERFCPRASTVGELRGFSMETPVWVNYTGGCLRGRCPRHTHVCRRAHSAKLDDPQPV